MTFMARDKNMWRLLMDTSQDPFTTLAAQWLGVQQSQVPDTIENFAATAFW